MGKQISFFTAFLLSFLLTLSCSKKSKHDSGAVDKATPDQSEQTQQDEDQADSGEDKTQNGQGDTAQDGEADDSDAGNNGADDKDDQSPIVDDDPGKDGNDNPGVSDKFRLVLGFDGTNDFSSLYPVFDGEVARLSDPSLAKLDLVEVDLPTAKVAAIVDEMRKKYPYLPETAFHQMLIELSDSQRAYKISPLKAGESKMEIVAEEVGEGEQAKIMESFSLTVNAYTPAQVESGKQRYNTNGGGKLKSCASCHAGSNPGAPPHQLGTILEMTDESVLSWIATGKSTYFKSSISHVWEFNSDAEKQGIVPYLRTLAAKDLEALTRLFAESIARDYVLIYTDDADEGTDEDKEDKADKEGDKAQGE